MSSALEPLLGTEATRNLSAANIAELKKVWQKEYNQWGNRNLAGKEYVYGTCSPPALIHSFLSFLGYLTHRG